MLGRHVCFNRLPPLVDPLGEGRPAGCWVDPLASSTVYPLLGLVVLGSLLGPEGLGVLGTVRSVDELGDLRMTAPIRERIARYLEGVDEALSRLSRFAPGPERR